LNTVVRSRQIWAGGAALAVGTAVGAGALLSTAPSAAATPTAPDHVVIAMEENHDLSQIIGNPAAPYINSLASQGVLYTDDTGKTHPSLPNYLDLYSGSTQGVTDDNCISSSANNLGVAIGAKVFDEDQGVCKHDAAENFTNTAGLSVPFSQFPADFTLLPKVSFVTPNLNDDMHDGTIQQGDSWLQAHLGAYQTWAQTHNSVFVLVFDENSSDTNLTVPLTQIITGQGIAPSSQSAHVGHENLLRTVEDWYSLPLLGGSATAADLPGVPMPWSGVSSPPPSTTSPSASPTPSTSSSSPTPTPTPAKRHGHGRWW